MSSNMEDFLDAMKQVDRGKPPTAPIGANELLEIINAVDEQTQTSIGGLSSDLRGLLVNLLATINLLVEAEVFTEAQFEAQVVRVATQIQNQMDPQAKPEDNLDDINVSN